MFLYLCLSLECLNQENGVITIQKNENKKHPRALRSLNYISHNADCLDSEGFPIVYVLKNDTHDSPKKRETSFPYFITLKIF